MKGNTKPGHQGVYSGSGVLLVIHYSKTCKHNNMMHGLSVIVQQAREWLPWSAESGTLGFRKPHPLPTENREEAPATPCFQPWPAEPTFQSLMMMRVAWAALAKLTLGSAFPENAWAPQPFHLHPTLSICCYKLNAGTGPSRFKG